MPDINGAVAVSALSLYSHWCTGCWDIVEFSPQFRHRDSLEVPDQQASVIAPKLIRQFQISSTGYYSTFTGAILNLPKFEMYPFNPTKPINPRL